MNVFKAMLVDAYRELNSRKLFWITLVISGLVVLLYGSLGFNQNGVSLFYGLKTVDSQFLNADSPLSAILYRAIFSSFIVSIWLAWIATILALISTATVFPDFLSGGAIDLVLSKPISRPVLFFNKYICSLLFVLLQVTLFCVGIFVCMGIRVGEWNPMIFAAIPLITFFYSLLFSVCVLVGTVTRSSLTALLLTLLFWFMLFSVNSAEGIVNQIKTSWIIDNEERTASVEEMNTELAALEQSSEADAGQEAATLESQIAGLNAAIEREADNIATINAWHQPVRYVKMIMPKTGETIGLLDRWLKKEGEIEFMDLLTDNITTDDDGNFVPRRTDISDRQVAMRIQEEYYNQSMWYILGTSAIFEAVLLGLACLVFIRRDF